MDCPVCGERIHRDESSIGTILGGVMECPNGCVACDCGKNRAEPDSDGCAECNLAEAIRVMNSEPFSIENQAEVAKWQIRASRNAMEAV